MKIDIITGPLWEPATVEEARAHCRIDGPDSDGLLFELIRRARETFESYTRAILLETTFETWRDDFPPCAGPLRPPRGPVRALPDDAVAVLDHDGVLQISPPGTLVARGGQILPRPGADWPSPGVPWLGCRLRWTAGITDFPSHIPPAAKLGMLQLVAHWYEHREAVSLGLEGRPLPYGVDLLWRPFRDLQL